MPYLYLIATVFLSGLYSIIGAFFNKKNSGIEGSSSFYSFLISCSVLLFWLVVFLFDRTFDTKVIIYSLLFGICYAVSTTAYILALKTGAIVLTGLFSQLSLIGTTIWGFFFWGAKFTPLVAIGIILVCLAIWLCLYKGKSEGKNEKKFNFKWLIFVCLHFLANAGCAIVQKTEQIDFNGNYGNFFMLIGVAFSTVTCLVVWLRDDKSQSLKVLKTSFYMPVIAGVANGGLNLFVILMATTYLSPSLIYPVIGVGGLMIVTLFSKFAFKEKLRWWQWLGVLIGAIAVAVLSI